MQWAENILQRLRENHHADGSWGYRSHGTGAAEPTALACMAMAHADKDRSPGHSALTWLASLQRTDGGVPITANVSSPCWPTPLAILAWRAAKNAEEGPFDVSCRKAANWLLNTGGERLDPMPEIYGHDTTLQGWSWAPETHSWVEPTSYAVLALREMGYADHPRVREAVTLLLDRAIPSGGWNYGNPRVFANYLRPFPATTGLALAALAGEKRDDKIDSAIDYLQSALPKVRSPLSMAWGVIGLTSWDHRPADAMELLVRTEQSRRSAHFDVLVDALLLLAGTQWKGTGSTL